MRRKTITIALLLLPLWLTAAAKDFNVVSDRGAALRAGLASISTATAHHQNNAGQDILQLKHALRHLARRIASSGDTLERPFTGGSSSIPVADPKSTSTLFSVVEPPADFIRGWQFHQRAASEPRAPSAVS